MKDSEERNPEFFPTTKALRNWFEKNHKSESELWVGFYKKGTGIQSIEWSESVDEALCFGWIDGIRKSVDEKSYKIRFTPRKTNSHWSKVNIKKVKKLKELGLMRPAGLKAFSHLKKENSGKASFEKKVHRFSSADLKKMKENETAWKNFKSMPNWVQRSSIHWVNSAKREETRERRIRILIENSGANEKIPLLRRTKEK